MPEQTPDLAAEQAEEPTAPSDAPCGANGPSTADGAEAVQGAAPRSPLSRAIAELEGERARTMDRLLRTAAEFENFKKRSRREGAESVRRAEDRLVLELLPVIDNMERALAHAEAEPGALVNGVRMVHRQLLGVLEKYDIKPFDAVDTPFDPERHEALQQMPSDKPARTVCQELQRGYVRGERLVRPALVVVSTGPAPASQGLDTTDHGQRPETEKQ